MPRGAKIRRGNGPGSGDALVAGTNPPMPRFQARFPWWGGDLQTLRNYVVRPASALPAARSRRLELPLSDGSGDKLLATLDEPAAPKATTVVLVHGLTGCQDSYYLLNSARFWLKRGYRVVRLNMRGAGPSSELCVDQYHAGASRDLSDAFVALADLGLSGPLVAVGYSLGGNILLKLLGEARAETPIAAAVSVSAPIDLEASSRHFLRPRNRLYARWLLGRMKEEASVPARRLSADERDAIAKSRTVYEFDDLFVAARNGFRDAEDYYAQCSAVGVLDAISVPTMVISARNDPWIPFEPYETTEWSQNRHLVPMLIDGGGHVGFHCSTSTEPWHDRAIAKFLHANRLMTD